MGISATHVQEATARMRGLFGKNKVITDGNYDRDCAVTCVNGTFVGQRRGDVIAYRGIPYVGAQPTGEHRWKAPVAFAPDDGVYEATYFGTVPATSWCAWRTSGRAKTARPTAPVTSWHMSRASTS